MILILFEPLPSYAYLDPGTGSMLVSAMVGVVATLFFFIKGVYYSGIGFFYTLLGKRTKKTKMSIVFYSEGKQYWFTFKPVIDALSKAGKTCTYLTSDEKDPGLTYLSAGLTAKYIGTGNKAFSVLNMLEADLCAMTTPGLDVLQIKRSPGVKHYAHIVHAVTDMALYKLYSFDYYDSILCSGKHQKRSIRELESSRATTKKILLDSGCPYLDVQVQALPTMNLSRGKTGEKPCVLIAPTWGVNGLLTRYGITLISRVAQMGYDVIIRPHPQSYLVEKELINKLKAATSAYSNVSWDSKPNGMESMVNSDALISDLSGIVFDYAFVLEKPVFTMDFKADWRGTEGSDLPEEAWEMGVLDQLGGKVDLNDIEKLPEMIKSSLTDPSYKKRIQSLRESSVYNFGNAGEVISQQLIDLAEKNKN